MTANGLNTADIVNIYFVLVIQHDCIQWLLHYCIMTIKKKSYKNKRKIACKNL